MGIRHGLGPVFACESLLGARRWQLYASRSCFVLVLLVGMACIWVGNTPGLFAPAAGATPSYKQMAAIGTGFFYALTGIQVSLILLAAPAAAAGSLGMDRARGTLLQMMVTDLSDGEIVLGTLAARLAPVLGLIVCAVPVTALAALLGGVDYAALGGALVVSLALALLGCVLALTVSVWVTRTHEVLMAVYIAEAFWLLAAPTWEEMAGAGPMAPPAWFWKANPYMLAFAPYWQPGYAGAADFAAFAGGVLAFSTVLVVLAIARLRPVVLAQSGQAVNARAERWRGIVKKVFPSWPSPSLDGNPVLWREWHRNRPSRLARALTALCTGVAWAQVAWGTFRVITDGLHEGGRGLEGGVQFSLVFGLLMVSAAASTTLAEERTRGSLDMLLATPLATRQIVVAKWWGVYRRVLVMLPLFLYVAFFEAATAPDLPAFPGGVRYYPRLVPLTPATRILGAVYCPVDFLVSGALLVSLGVALATWVRRLGRAVALSVIVFFLIGLGWPILVGLTFAFLVSEEVIQSPAMKTWINDNYWVQENLMALSPMFGPTTSFSVFQWNQGKRTLFWVSLGVVIVVKAAAAGVLLWGTIMTFDRCMGRVSESPRDRRGKGHVVRDRMASGASPPRV